MLSSAIEVHRWAVNVRQTAQLASSRPQPIKSGPYLTLFRSELLEKADKCHKDLETYLNRLNALSENTETLLVSCSKFAENCSRFVDWLASTEAEWSIPKIDAIDTLTLDEDKPLWERHAMLTTYKVISFLTRYCE